MLLKNNAEGGFVGSQFTTANSGGLSGNSQGVQGTVFFARPPAPGHGGCCLTTVSGASYTRWTSLSMTEYAFRGYFYATAIPTVAALIVALDRPSSAQGLRVGVNTSGRFIVQNAAGQTNTATAEGQLPLNQWFRIEAQVKVGTTTSNGTFRVQVFLGESTTPFWTLANEGGANLGASAMTVANAGRFSGTFAQLFWDDIAVQDSFVALGPEVQPPVRPRIWVKDAVAPNFGARRVFRRFKAIPVAGGLGTRPLGTSRLGGS